VEDIVNTYSSMTMKCVRYFVTGRGIEHPASAEIIEAFGDSRTTQSSPFRPGVLMKPPRRKPMQLKMMLSALVIAAAALQALPAAADESKPVSLPRTAAPAGVELYIISPKDGETLGQDVTVRFGLRGMGVSPAGTMKEGTGHHHLLIDADVLPPLDQPIPADDRHKHFGGGQTEVTIKLAPGKHTLQLDLGDALHMQFDPPIVSKKISVAVK